MSKRIDELFLFDVWIAILKIEKVTANFARAEEIKDDFVSWDSVIREFEIMGEAVKLLIKNNILSRENRIVVDFRNFIIHHYFGIDAEEIWNVINDDLKDFKKIIESKILEIESSLKKELILDLIEENSNLNFIIKELKGIGLSDNETTA